MMLARQFYRRFSGVHNLERSDLEQEALVGLVRAAANADANLESKFKGYASQYIHGSLKGYTYRKIQWRSRSDRKRHPDEPDRRVRHQGLFKWQEVVDTRSSSKGDELDIFREMPITDQKIRIILLLRYVENKTFTEIARDLGVSQVTVSTLHRNALRRLKEWKTGRLEPCLT
jgi:RNA polymerase sigma factor (sigma-70 family)